MNIYDFDKTIYDGDSTADFIKYCAKRFPKAYVIIFPALWAFLLYVLNIYTKTQFKERMYGFLRYIPDIDSTLENFWDSHENKIFDYYKSQQRENDIIISASPQFLLTPICRRLGIKHLIASRVDKHSGKYTGENCHGAEKVVRLKEEYGISHCSEFYSDSYSDTPLAETADKAYIVRRGVLTPWHEYTETKAEKAKHMFLAPQFLMFLIIGAINTLNNVLFSAVYSIFIPGTTLAFLPGYISANIVSYILNSIFTFKERFGIVKFVKFFISYIPNFIIQTVVVWLYERFIHGPAIIAYIIAAVIGLPLTFVLMKIFAFGKKPCPTE